MNDIRSEAQSPNWVLSPSRLELEGTQTRAAVEEGEEGGRVPSKRRKKANEGSLLSSSKEGHCTAN